MGFLGLTSDNGHTGPKTQYEALAEELEYWAGRSITLQDQSELQRLLSHAARLLREKRSAQ